MRGVTYDQVEAAARDILRQGRSPSVQAVRSVLGTGSATTVNQHLREFWMRLGESMEVPDLEGLPESLVEPLRALWNQAREAALDKLAQEREKARGEAEQALEEVERARLERDQLRQQMDQLSTDLASSQEHNQSLTDSHAALQAQLRDTTTQLHAAQAESEQKSQAHGRDRQHFAQQLRHYRQLVKERDGQLRTGEETHTQALKSERQRSEAQEAHWLQELDRVREDAKARIGQTEADKQGLEERLEKSQVELEQTRADARERDQRWERQIQAVREEAAQRVEALQAALAKAMDEAAGLRAELKAAKAQTKKLRQQYTRVANERDRLRHEKAELSEHIRRLERGTEE